MPLLDDRGRLFGKVNLIDAAILVVVLGLVPLGYASWKLFRTPPATFQAVNALRVRPNEEGRHIQLNGQHFRPYFRAHVGVAPAKYLFATPTQAEILVPALPAGTYDLILFDETTEIWRQPQAVTVLATPPPIITSVTPRVLEFTREPQPVLLKGERFPPSLKAMIGPFTASYTASSPTAAEVMAPAMAPGTFDLILADEVAELVRVPKAITVPKPAVDRITPRVVEARRDGQRVELRGRHFQPTIRMFVGWKEVNPQFFGPEAAEFLLPPMTVGSYDLAVFDASGGTEYVRYRNAITIRPAQIVELKLRVRFVMRPEVLALIKQGQANAPEPGGARLLSFQAGEELVGTTRTEKREGPVVIVDGVVQVPAVRQAAGWHFDGQSLKAGAPFVLRTQNYQLDGEILSIEPPPARAK